MRAIQFEAFGGPSQLRAVTLPNPVVTAGMALVRVEAASINPSDVKNVSGMMSQTTLPRVPGRDYAGVVEQGPVEWLGVQVWGSGGDVGFTRDGTYTERLLVPVTALSRMPDHLSFAEAASVGVNFITAWCAVVEGAALRAGETLLVIGVGGVGGAAAQIARRLGARVIGADRRRVRPGTLAAEALHVQLVAEPDLPAAVLAVTEERGADVVLDCVGGRAMCATAMRCLAPRGRLVEISATGGREVTFDLAAFYHNESRLLGVDSLKRDLIQCAAILDEMTPYFADGTFHPSPVVAEYALEDAAEAFRRVEAGEAGRIVLLPQR